MTDCTCFCEGYHKARVRSTHRLIKTKLGSDRVDGVIAPKSRKIMRSPELSFVVPLQVAGI